MIIDRNVILYTVLADDTIRAGLTKINANEEGAICVVNPSGVLEGVLTDGDFRRWVLAQEKPDLTQPIGNIINRNFRYAYFSESTAKIQSGFSDDRGIRFLPLLDSSRRLIAVATDRKHVIRIGSREVGGGSGVFVIAELGNNHNGSLSMAKSLVDHAHQAGADCIKFQMRNMATLYRNSGSIDDSLEEDLGSQYTLDILSRNQLSADELFSMFDYVESKGLVPLCTPWDLESLAALESYGLPAYKIASADLSNHEMLTAAARTGKPLIISTGMSTDDEIHEAVRVLKNSAAQYVLLHCNSTYPAPFKDINISYMNRLKQIGECPVGYSSHDRGINVCIAAVGLGASVIEKHFTLDRTLEGNDHRVSLLPHEFLQMVEGIRDVEQSLGSGLTRHMSQGELMNREVLGKSLVVNRDTQAGEIIREDMIEVRSPGQGLSPSRKREIIGTVIRRDIRKWGVLYPADLGEEDIAPRNYQFGRPFGVPVRFHDFQALSSKSNLDLVEFHLSFKDLDERLERHFTGPSNIDLIVHAPELFSGDHILDLCSDDIAYRRRSIAELNRVVELCEKLKEYFPKTKRPLLIVNVGGATQDRSLPEEGRSKYYGILLESLAQIDQSEIEILPQTMPPFPWHFGGQRFHNLFVAAEEIAEFCEKHSYRICLDVSHSKLACNHARWDFDAFIRRVGPHVAHLHIADARGVDGEGLSPGEGDIDFVQLFQTLDAVAPRASFIPEVWQGHKNGGQGFWRALDQLERLPKVLRNGHY